MNKFIILTQKSMEKNMIKKSVLLFFAMVFTQNLFAQWSGLSNTNNAVCALEIGDQTKPAMASDGMGGVVIAWEDSRTNNHEIYAQRIMNGTGIEIWPHNGVIIPGAAGKDQFAPAIVGDGTGGAIIIWRDERNINTSIYAQHILVTGTIDPAWPAGGRLLSNTTGNALVPAIISDGAGGAIVAWTDSRNAASGSDIYAQRITAAGVIAWTAGGVPVCTEANAQSRAQLVSDGAGGAIVSWDDYRTNNGNNIDIYARRVNAAGALQWTNNGVAVCAELHEQKNIKILSDGAGGAIFTWTDSRTTDSKVYARHINGGGTLLGNNDVLVSLNAAGTSAINPDMASDGAGGSIITWQDNRTGNNDIYARSITAAGVPGTEVTICTDATSQDIPKIVSSNIGGAIITWQDQRNSSSSTDIYAQRIASTGTTVDPLWPVNGVAISTAPNPQHTQTLVSDGNGGAIITWEDKRSSFHSHIYAQKIAADATPLPLSLVSFSGKPAGSQVNLNWQTASEQNTAHFIVEYSIDEAFKPIGTVAAAGNSSDTKNYNFTHQTPKNGNNYYRLKMADADGQFTYSPVVQAKLSLKETGMSVYPNPNQGEFTINLNGIAEDYVQVRISTMSGKKVWNKQYSGKEGSIRIKLDQAVSAGEYVLTLTAGNHRESQKLMVVE